MVDIDKKEINKFKSNRFFKINIEAENFINTLISNNLKLKKIH